MHTPLAPMGAPRGFSFCKRAALVLPSIFPTHNQPGDRVNKVTVEIDGHTVKGWAEFSGPHAEIEGVEITSVVPDNSSAEFLEAAEAAVESAAYKVYRERHGYPDYDDDRDDYAHASTNGDYWIDSESGEYRCG